MEPSISVVVGNNIYYCEDILDRLLNLCVGRNVIVSNVDYYNNDEIQKLISFIYRKTGRKAILVTKQGTCIDLVIDV